MMTCDGAAPLLAAAGDGILDDERRAALDAHLIGCGACRTALADQIAVREWLSSTQDAAVPAGFAERVRACIDDSQTLLGVADFRLWTLRLAPLAALLALGAWLGLGAATASTPASAPTVATASAVFTPARAADWQRSVSGNALLEAALSASPSGDGDVR